MVNESVFAWVGDAFVPITACDQQLLVADSFLVSEGVAVAPDKHFARFTESSMLVGVQVPETFFSEAKKLIPNKGNVFPRFELISNSTDGLQLRVRVAPVLQDTANVVTAQGDHRTSPLVKGPDLEAGVGVRKTSGQDEAIILSEGLVVEGVYSSLVWWKNDQMFRVPASIPRLPSITESIIVETAERLGASILEQQIKPMELADAELWLLSALHGIRTVTSWVGGPKLKIEPGRVEYWRTMRGLYKVSL